MSFMSYFTSLPVVVQGFFLGAILVAGLSAAWAALWVVSRSVDRLTIRPSGATPRTEPAAAAEQEQEPEELTTPLPEPALSEEEVAELEVPAILRRSPSYTKEGSVKAQLVPITERLFRKTDEVRKRKEECSYSLTELTAFVNAFRYFGASSATPTSHWYHQS